MIAAAAVVVVVVVVVVLIAVSLNIPHISTYWVSFVFSLHEQ